MPSTPSTPATPRRRGREIGIRRPRVAGKAPAAARSAESARREDARPDDGSTVDVLAPQPGRPDTVEPQTVEPQTVESQTVESQTVESRTGAQTPPAAPRAETGADTGIANVSRPSGKRDRPPPRLPSAVRTRRRIPTLVLVGALVVLTAAAVFFGIAGVSLRNTPAAQNSALVDVGATAQATQQLGDALKAAYSYDFARLDQNEAAARAGIVPDSTFMTQYEQLFAQVRQLAPTQKAVVTATISTAAVREVTGDRAVVVIFLDQQITRVETGNQPRQDAAAARLTVTGQLVDGAWKISDLQVL